MSLGIFSCTGIYKRKKMKLVCDESFLIAFHNALESSQIHETEFPNEELIFENSWEYHFINYPLTFNLFLSLYFLKRINIVLSY